MKRFIQTTLLLLALLLPATAHGFEVDGIFYDITSDTTVTVLGGQGSDIVIPETVTYNDTTYTVTAIGDNAFATSEITRVVIGDSVKSVGRYAFVNCTGLKNVTIGKSVPTLRYRKGSAYFYAFKGCDNITSLTWNAVHCSDLGGMGTTNIDQVTIGSEVEVIPENFVNSSLIAELIIPNSVTTISSGAFANCYLMSDVTIGNSVTSIGASAFFNCELLENVDIPNKVTTIGNSAFKNCYSLRNIDIPNSVTTIGDGAFANCYSMSDVTIGNSVTSIGGAAFGDCWSLEEINIPSSVTQIIRGAFGGCEKLSRVHITSLEAWCSILFDYYSSMSENYREGTSNPLYYAHHLYLNSQEITDLVIPNSVTAINGFAFIGCSGLKSVTLHNSVNSIGESAFMGCSGIKSIAIPNSVTNIGYWAFKDCTGLTNVTIGNALAGIAGNVFSGCSELSSIRVADDNPVYDSRENCNAIIETESNTLMVGCQGTIIPRSVTSIAPEAFEGRGNLTSIFIPKTVTSIGIETYLDYSYNQETHSTDTVYRYYYYNPFAACNALASIIVEEGNPVYDSRDNCNAIIETATNKLIVGCKNTIIPNTVTAIGGGALSGCTELTEINIPNSVIAIGDRDDFYGAFGGCTGLTKVTFGNSVTTIGTAAFMGCTGLTNIDLPSSLTTIGVQAFAFCTGLTSVTIPNSVNFDVMNGPDIQQFYRCIGLTSVTIGSGVTDMGITFLECPNITSVTCLATTPPACHTFQMYVNGERIIVVDFDSEVVNQATLYVPAASLEAYQTAAVWRGFQHIEPIPAVTGDVDGDGVVGIADITDLIDMLLNGDVSIETCPAADVDGDGIIGIADITELIDTLLNG